MKPLPIPEGTIFIAMDERRVRAAEVAEQAVKKVLSKHPQSSIFFGNEEIILQAEIPPANIPHSPRMKSSGVSAAKNWASLSSDTPTPMARILEK